MGVFGEDFLEDGLYAFFVDYIQGVAGDLGFEILRFDDGFGFFD